MIEILHHHNFTDYYKLNLILLEIEFYTLKHYNDNAKHYKSL